MTEATYLITYDLVGSPAFDIQREMEEIRAIRRSFDRMVIINEVLDDLELPENQHYTDA